MIPCVGHCLVQRWERPSTSMALGSSSQTRWLHSEALDRWGYRESLLLFLWVKGQMDWKADRWRRTLHDLVLDRLSNICYAHT